ATPGTARPGGGPGPSPARRSPATRSAARRWSSSRSTPPGSRRSTPGRRRRSKARAPRGPVPRRESSGRSPRPRSTGRPGPGRGGGRGEGGDDCGGPLVPADHLAGPGVEEDQTPRRPDEDAFPREEGVAVDLPPRAGPDVVLVELPVLFHDADVERVQEVDRE